MKPLQTRFLLIFRSIVPTERGCMEWPRTRDAQNYGILTFQRKRVLAHRAAWLALRGPIPSGMYVCHACDNPPCCNPDHLWLGTNSDNQRDSLAKGRHHNTRYIGDRNHATKLTADQVRAIRASPLSQRVLAREYGVSHNQIGYIKRRVCWAHVP